MYVIIIGIKIFAPFIEKSEGIGQKTRPSEEGKGEATTYSPKD